MTNQASIDILTEVLEGLIDSADGYEAAAKIAERDAFQKFFSQRAGARRAMAATVRSEIANLGGTPEADGTLLANAHRVFMKVVAAIQDNDEAAIEAVDDGEEHLREKIKAAMDNAQLLPKSKVAMSQFQGELEADCRMIDQLEDTV